MYMLIYIPQGTNACAHSRRSAEFKLYLNRNSFDHYKVVEGVTGLLHVRVQYTRISFTW